MYSDRTNVNILTALVQAHGIRHAVLCPGSRNAPLLHNLSQVCQSHSVVDERSAGFVALGMADTTGEAVLVCVTSGSALLNVLPAVAEAFYRHRALVVVSADRPQAWIGQLDGQTLPQEGALQRFVGCSVHLPEPKTEEERWHCTRLVNEAILAARQHGGQPVHINVPVSEPLYCFTEKELPKVQAVAYVPATEFVFPDKLRQALGKAQRMLLVVGQLPYGYAFPKILHSRWAVLREALSGDGGMPLEEMMERMEDATAFYPDMVIYVGDCLVSKRTKEFLRAAAPQTVWGVAQGQGLSDPTMHLTHRVDAAPQDFLNALAEEASVAQAEYIRRWAALQADTERALAEKPLVWDEDGVVRRLECELAGRAEQFIVCYANSTAVRLGCRHAKHRIEVNRGVNGIEGCVSTAVGMALASDKTVVLVVGDLSFFYDSNALWQQELKGRLRIILLNNGEGGIFRKFRGLEGETSQRFVMAPHHSTAEGLCHTFGVTYCSLEAGEDMQKWAFLPSLTEEAERAMVLEVKL